MILSLVPPGRMSKFTSKQLQEPHYRHQQIHRRAEVDPEYPAREKALLGFARHGREYVRDVQNGSKFIKVSGLSCSPQCESTALRIKAGEYPFDALESLQVSAHEGYANVEGRFCKLKQCYSRLLVEPSEKITTNEAITLNGEHEACRLDDHCYFYWDKPDHGLITLGSNPIQLEDNSWFRITSDQDIIIKDPPLKLDEWVPCDGSVFVKVPSKAVEKLKQINAAPGTKFNIFYEQMSPPISKVAKGLFQVHQSDRWGERINKLFSDVCESHDILEMPQEIRQEMYYIFDLELDSEESSNWHNILQPDLPSRMATSDKVRSSA